VLLPAEPTLQPLEQFPDVTLVFPSSKVIRDVIKVHMEELSSHWQEEQGRAGDAAEKYASVFMEEMFAYSILCLCQTRARW
jgi:hypothetical protein